MSGGKHYVIGDVHGETAILQNLIKEAHIDADNDYVYFVGDYYTNLSSTIEKDKELFSYLNKYYVVDIDKPGFHLIRGNHEWDRRHLNEGFGNIEICNLPDIIRLEIRKIEFVIAHSGMHQDIYKFMEGKSLAVAQIDTNWRISSGEIKYYRSIIWTPKNNIPNYKSEYRKKINENKDIFIIHGHCPVYNLCSNEGDEYRYKGIEKDGRLIAAIDDEKLWIDIDAGIKKKKSLTVICLEEFIDDRKRWNEEYQNYQCFYNVNEKKENEDIESSNNKKELNDEERKLILSLKKIIKGKKDPFDTLSTQDEIKKIKYFLENKLNIEEYFLEKADDKNKEYKKYNDFIDSMKRLAAVKDNEENNHSIDEAIMNIIKFVINNQSLNPMVKNMFGFTSKEDFKEENWKEYLEKMPVKQKKYFIADLKIKSTVYLLRIYHFIEYMLSETSKKDIFRNYVSELSLKEIKEFFGEEKLQEESKSNETVFQYYDNKKIREETSNNKSKAAKYLEYCSLFLCNSEFKSPELADKFAKKAADLEEDILIRENKETKTLPLFQNYKEKINSEKKDNERKLEETIYYLFDNSMQEVEFCGVEWNWRWRYKQGKSDLFRCFEKEEEQIYDKVEGNGYKYYQNMIRNVVNHMNPKNEMYKKIKLASYSKNPYRDIYKYMSWKCDKNVDFSICVNNSGEYIVQRKEQEGKTITFSMVKQADTNIIKHIKPLDDTSEGDFTITYIKNNIYSDETNKYCCINEDMSFDDLKRKEIDNESEYIFCIDILNNAALYVGDVRRVFNRYTKLLTGVSVESLNSHIVSSLDKEVVMLGNTCNKIINVEEESDGNKKYIDLEDNTEYRVKLNEKDIVTLIRELSEIKEDNEEDVLLKRMEIMKEGYRSVIKVGDMKVKIDIAKEKIDEKTKEEIKKAIVQYIMNFKSEDSWKIKFIMEFIKNCDYKGKRDYGKFYQEGDTFINLCKQIYLKESN